MHPGNDIKNCQADPTTGTSPGEGVEIGEFLQNSKFVDYQKNFTARLLPGNNIKNCQADPTRGTSPGEGVEIVEFLQNSKFVDSQKKFTARLLECT